MKYKIIGAFMICLLSVTTKMYASSPKAGDDFNIVVNKFINSIVTSDYKELRSVLDEKLRFKISHLNSVMIFKKSTVVEDIKWRNGRQQPFKPSYVVLAQSDAVTIVQVDFQYENTVMQNFIFLEKDQDNEWKIKQVYELFKTIDNIKTKDSIAVSK